MTSAELAAALARPENADLAALVRYIVDQGEIITTLRAERDAAVAERDRFREIVNDFKVISRTPGRGPKDKAKSRTRREIAFATLMNERDAAVERARTARADALTEAAVLCGKWATECYQRGAARWDNRAAAYENAEANFLALRTVEQGGADG